MKELKFNGNKMMIGPGSLEVIPELVGQRIFIITGHASMFKNGTIDAIEALLKKDNRAYKVYSDIAKNPTKTAILAGTEVMKAFGPDTVLAVGGGSALDAAKVMALLADQPSLTIDDLKEGRAPQARENIALIAVPSTSGTASEVTRAAVVTFEEEHIKIGVKTKAFIPDYAILDGNLTLSMPQSVVAETGMDALTHAVESYINKNSDDFCKAISKGAVEGLIKYLPSSYEQGDLESRQHVHNFQSLAGMAFQNAGLGMDHGISHAVGGLYNYGHGLLNAIGLPYILEYNQRDPQVKADLAELSRMIQKDIIQAIKDLNTLMGIPSSFQALGLEEERFLADYPLLLENALKGSTRGNPVKMDADAMDQVLRSIYYGKVEF